MHWNRAHLYNAAVILRGVRTKELMFALTSQGEKASDRVLEVFAEKVADTIVQGELYVGGWIPGAQKGGADLSVRCVFCSSPRMIRRQTRSTSPPSLRSILNDIARF